jgi:hypothetical protein
MAMRQMGDEPLAAGTPATQRRHVGFDPGLVDETQTALINLALMGLPSGAVTSELWPQLFSRKNAFFEALVRAVQGAPDRAVTRGRS